MEVFNFANNIYESEVKKNPYLCEQREIISLSAIVHDMCDKKYMNETEGIINIKNYMKDYLPESELEVVTNIISRMSYSKVKKDGYPDLGKYQQAYHIVREADLLASYDFDRAMIYNMYHTHNDVFNTFKESKEFFENRVLKYQEQDIFLTDYGKSKARELRIKSIEQINSWNSIIHSFERYI
jgi:hypothetical protein